MEGHNHPYRLLPPHPWDNQNYLMRCLMLWIYPFLRKGFSGNISESDIVRVMKSADSQTLGRELFMFWEKSMMTAQVNDTRPSLLCCFWRVHKTAIITSLVLVVLSDFVFRLIFTLTIPQVVDGFKTSTGHVDGLIFTMFLFFVASVVTGALGQFITSLYTLKFRIALCSLINKKVLRLSEADLSNYQQYRVTGLVTSECHKISKMAESMPILLSYALRIILTGILLVHYLGTWSLIVICSFLLINSLQTALSHHEYLQQSRILQFTERRVSFLYRALQSIKLIKILVLELPYIKTILSVRSKEVEYLKRIYYSRYFSLATVGLINVAWFTAIGITMALNTAMTTGEFFLLVAMLSELKIRMYFGANCLNDFIDGIGSVKQVQSFLEMADSSLIYGIKRSSSKPQLSVNKLKVGWIEGGDTILEDITFVLGNETAFLCGASGSGKSTLLKALVDEVPCVEGSVHIEGAVAFIPQHPWIFKATIEQNILFGLPYCFEKYQKAIDGASLMTEINILPMSDRTVISDDSPLMTDTLRAKVSLARAIYQDADIYLIDNLFTHMDKQTARQVFQSSVQGVLENKTIIVVADSLELCKAANKVFIVQDKMLKEVNDKKEVELLKLTSSPEFRQIPDDVPVPCIKAQKPPDMTSLHQFCNLYRLRKVPEPVWRSYKKLITRREIRTVLTIWAIAAILHFICQVSSDIAMADWNQEAQTVGSELDLSNAVRNKYIRYGVLVVTSLVLHFTSAAFLVITVSKLLWVLHGKATSNVFYSKLHLLEAESTGNIIHSFWKELEILDKTLLLSLMSILLAIGDCGSFLILGIMIKPITILVFIIFFVGLHFLRATYVQASSGLCRLQTSYNCRMMTRLQSTCEGLIVIRKSGREELIDGELNDDINLVSTIELTKISLISWMLLFLSFLILITFYIVLTVLYHSGHDGTESYVGLFINIFLVISYTLPQLFLSNVGLNLSIERGQSLQCCENISREDTEKVAIPLPRNWPTRGNIEFKNVSMGNISMNTSSLTKFDFFIESNEKVGILSTQEVEKFSIVSALLRLYPFEGNIFIDGVNIQDIYIHDLRNSISVITKSPLIFDGSIRFNLDPTDVYGDAEIMAVLEEVHLKDYIVSFPRGLLENITKEDGRLENKHKKLLCLARTILQRNRILILDASITDVDDESLRQIMTRKLKTMAQDMTVIIISTEEDSLEDCDVVLKAEDGVIKECESRSSCGYGDAIYTPLKPPRFVQARTI